MQVVPDLALLVLGTMVSGLEGLLPFLIGEIHKDNTNFLSCLLPMSQNGQIEYSSL